MPLRVLLVAEEAAGVRALRTLIALDCDVAVVASADGTATSSVWGAAGAARVHRWDVRDVMRSPAGVGEFEPEILLNVHSLHILPADLLSMPSVGAFNLHPGPLPEMAGLDTVSHAILEERSTYGVTLHWMVPRVDAGAIAYEDRFEIAVDATALTLYGEAQKRGARLIERLVEDHAAGRRPPAREQDASRRRYYARGVPNEGVLDWRHSASHLAAFVRACDYGPFPSPWGRPRTWADGVEVELLSAAVEGSATEGPVVDARATEANVAAHSRRPDGVPAMPPGTCIEVQGGDALVATGAGVLTISRVRAHGNVVDAGAVVRPGARLGST